MVNPATVARLRGIVVRDYMSITSRCSTKEPIGTSQRVTDVESTLYEVAVRF